MKILCVIDHFGSGGAQRQIVNLACALKSRGHQVEFFIYFPHHDFFRSVVDRAGIPVHEARKGSGFSVQVLWRLVRVLRSGSYDGVISFLDSPNVYAELACLASPGTRLIVSERASRHNDRNRLVAFARRLLHASAHAVVANSRSHATWLARRPGLGRRTTTIYNGYPIEAPIPSETVFRPPFRLLVIGRVGPEKNGLRLIAALELIHRKHGRIPHVTWVGRQDGRPRGLAYRRDLERLLARYPHVKSHWTWLGERSDIADLLSRHHALIHPSLHEGLPNVVCEAFISARPVLASDVCDHSLLVEEGRRGFLFDPNDPRSIAAAIERLCALSGEQWEELSANARRYAERHLGVDRMAREYEALLTGLIQKDGNGGALEHGHSGERRVPAPSLDRK